MMTGGKKDTEGKRKEWKSTKRRISACWKSKISTWAAEQCQRPSMPPWLPSSHIVAALCPRTHSHKIQQLVSYFHNCKSLTRTHTHTLYNNKACSIGQFLFKSIYTDAQAYTKSGWSWLMKRSWRERREASSTTADGEIDSYTACISSLSLELNHRRREGGREEEGEWWVNMEDMEGERAKESKKRKRVSEGGGRKSRR